MLEVRLHSYGPKTSVEWCGGRLEVGPDEFIAAEGIGTYGGLGVEAKVAELLKSGKDLGRVARRMHRDSTRRGHASITTSLHIQLEVLHCSRALSLILVAPPFGSYLQESQRRIRADESHVVEPEGLGDGLKMYRETFGMLLSAYSRLVDGGVELEDARYLLPIGTATSLFISSSFENYVGLLQLCLGDGGMYVPTEAARFAEKYAAIVGSLAPSLYTARMSFRNRLTAYPYPMVFKPHDRLMERLVADSGFPPETTILKVINCLGEMDVAKTLLAEGVKECLDTVNPILAVATLEPMSLVAFHQAVRHRTVPTAVESIYTAAERACKNPVENIVTPPSIRRGGGLWEIFRNAIEDSLTCYRELVDMGVKPSSAAYILPQAIRVYSARLYNGYNLIYPQGFIGTRTCSYTQWEERGIAYRIWRELEKTMPELADLMGEKCRYLGYCPEKDWCPIITKYHIYDDNLHRMHSEK